MRKEKKISEKNDVRKWPRKWIRKYKKLCDVKVMVWKYERREKKRGAWLLWGTIKDKEES